MNTYKQLRNFKPEELLLDDAETRIVLKFIFKPTDHPAIDSLPMSDVLRRFAQGLLVEAIDASYAIGFVYALFRGTANPSKGAEKILKDFGRSASKLWFEHATVHDLMDVKVYQFVLDRLAINFRNKLLGLVTAKYPPMTPIGAFLAYPMPARGSLKVWG